MDRTDRARTQNLHNAMNYVSEEQIQDARRRLIAMLPPHLPDRAQNNRRAVPPPRMSTPDAFEELCQRSAGLQRQQLDEVRQQQAINAAMAAAKEHAMDEARYQHLDDMNSFPPRGDLPHEEFDRQMAMLWLHSEVPRVYEAMRAEAPWTGVPYPEEYLRGAGLQRQQLDEAHRQMAADTAAQPWATAPYPDAPPYGEGLRRHQLHEVRRRMAADAAAPVAKTEDEEKDNAAEIYDARRGAAPGGATYYEAVEAIEKDMPVIVKDLVESMKALHEKVDGLQAEIDECKEQVKETEGVLYKVNRWVG